MPHTRPAKGIEVLCSTCIAPNKDKKTAAFNDPLVAYVGRYVDSANTKNVQHVGMRTARAQKVRVSRPRNRIFVEYGEAVAAFPIDQFLLNIAVKDQPGVGVMKTGSTVKRFGDPTETVAKPSTFFYSEAKAAGWVCPTIDIQETLSDFDVDDDGNVYTGTFPWGWGIARDENTFADTRPMEFRCQVADAPIIPHVVIALKPGSVPFAVISASDVKSASKPSLLVYDVSNPAAPVLKDTRKGKPNGIIFWARHDPGKRLAVVNSDRKLRIYAYDKFISGAPEVIAFDPTDAKRTFTDLSFDENGTLWAVESGKAPGNKLWQLTPSGNTYKPTLHAVLTGPFSPVKVAARKGYIAVGGNIPGDGPTDTKTELRLFRITAGKPVFVDTGNFFFRYYHDKTPPVGFASASTYENSTTSLSALHILDHGGKTYLFYSANGLGDVYELKPV